MTALAGRAFGLATVDMAESTLVGFRRGRGLLALLAPAILGYHRRGGRRGFRGCGRRGTIVVRRFAGGERYDRERYDEEERDSGPAEPGDVRGYHGSDTS